MSETSDEVGKRVRLAFEKLQPRLKSAKMGIIMEELYPRSDWRQVGLFVAYFADSRTPALFLRCKKQIAEQIHFPKNTDWFAASWEVLEDKQLSKCYLIIKLADEDCLEMFSAHLVPFVVKDVSHCALELSFSCTNRDKHLADAFRRSVKKWWRENKTRNDILTIPKQWGLFAELWFLQNWVMKHHAVDSAIKYWVGPYRKDHDFQFPYLGIEVKAVGSADDDPEIRISNEFQLDALRRDSNVKAKLFLFCLYLRESEGDENDSVMPKEGKKAKIANPKPSKTLYEMVESVRSFIRSKNPKMLETFQSSLASVGYRTKHQDEYKKHQLRVEDSNRPSFYEIADQPNGERFPRIVRSDVFGSGKELPISIRRVKYHLRLDSIATFACASEYVLKHF